MTENRARELSGHHDGHDHRPSFGAIAHKFARSLT
ncbi:MAG: hypothetical protein RIS46_913, partial [Actinomycetota bacterium]